KEVHGRNSGAMWAVGNQMMTEDHHREIPLPPTPPIAKRERRGIHERLEQQFPGWPAGRIVVGFILALRREFLFHLQQVLVGRLAKILAGANLWSFGHRPIGEVANRSYDEVGPQHVGLQRQALQIVEGLDRNQRRTKYSSHIYLRFDPMDGDADFFLVVE